MMYSFECQKCTKKNYVPQARLDMIDQNPIVCVYCQEPANPAEIRTEQSPAGGRLSGLVGQEVEVVAAGCVYRGILMEITESEVNIRGEMRFISVPAHQVKEVRRPGEGLAAEKEQSRYIHKSFYSADLYKPKKKPPAQGQPQRRPAPSGERKPGSGGSGGKDG